MYVSALLLRYDSSGNNNNNSIGREVGIFERLTGNDNDKSQVICNIMSAAFSVRDI